MAFVITMESAVTPQILQNAFLQVVAASDVLRTTITSGEGMQQRHVNPSGPRGIETVDLSNSTDIDREIHEWAEDRARRQLTSGTFLFDAAALSLPDGNTGFYINLHHLIVDGWTLILLLRAMDRCMLEEQPELYLPSYYDASFSHGSQYDKAFWDELASRTPALLPFYGEQRNPTKPASKRYTQKLTAEEMSRLRRLIQHESFIAFTPELSDFIAFATALFGWLHRVTGEHLLAIDCPAHNRLDPKAKETLGPFIQMYPLCVEVSGDESFTRIGEKVREQAQLLLRHAHPGLDVQLANRPQVVLNYAGVGLNSFAGKPLNIEWIHPGYGDPHHIMRIQVHDFNQQGAYTLHFDFNQESFTDSQAELAIGHFQRMLEAMLANPDLLVGNVDILSEQERELILTKFNRTDSQPVPDTTVVERFESSVSSHGNAAAIHAAGKTLTFCDVDCRANQIAHALRNRGVGTGSFVGLYLSRGSELLCSLLGVLKAGAAYVPLDPSHPETRTSAILEDAGLKLVLTTRDMWSRRTGFTTEAACLDEGFGAGQPVEPPEWRPGLEDFAYLIYTSGSTGTPKGVPITHAGLADYITWAERMYVGGERMAFPWFTSVAYDLTVTSLYLPLLTGGTLHIYTETAGPVDAALLDVVAENKVDFIKLTPSHLSLLAQCNLRDSRLKCLVLGGEDLRTDLAARVWRQLGGQSEIYNEYGPTEAVVGCMIHRFEPDSDVGLSVPIGRPADHVQVYAVNDQSQLVPIGVPGELCISRHGQTRGYHGSASSRDHCFQANPFQPDSTWYRTGDLVRFHASDSMTYLGRTDRQIKLRGMRVEPGEIEAALCQHKDIREALVVSLAPTTSNARPAGHCKRCGIPSDFPEIVFDDDDVCSICTNYEDHHQQAQAYFGTLDEFRAALDATHTRTANAYDCMMLLSGGKDSTYALCQLVDMGYRVYGFSLDNGFISEGAKANIRRAVEVLGIDHEFASTPAMNRIFKDSLDRFSNVCQGCFKTIYTLSINRAHELGIAAIVTGLSRGQFFETRLTDDLFRDRRFSIDDIDRAVLEARKVYHRFEDEVTRSLDTRLFDTDDIFTQIEILDFYRFCNVSMAEMLNYLVERAAWVRPPDTGRSTNCLINEVGIYVHQQEQGFHNYALPYSWDVRLGHKIRAEAIHELDDELNMHNIRTILKEIGYELKPNSNGTKMSGLAAYYVADKPCDIDEIRRVLQARIPTAWIPNHFIHLNEMPITQGGKIDLNVLPTSGRAAPTPASADYTAPRNDLEKVLVTIWQEVLKISSVGIHENFFEIGGHSLSAMEVTYHICQRFKTAVPLSALFQAPTVAELAKRVEEAVIRELEEMSDEEAELLFLGKET